VRREGKGEETSKIGSVIKGQGRLFFYAANPMEEVREKKERRRGEERLARLFRFNRGRRERGGGEKGRRRVDSDMRILD